MNRNLKGVDPAVFWGSAVMIAAFVGWGLLAPKSLGKVMSSTLGWVIGNFGWTFVLIAFGALALCIFLVIHPWGTIRLGPDDSRPEFRTFSWVSMMFAAGLGAGLLFYGIAEPVSHWTAPPHGLAEPRSEEAALVALRYTYFHWGFNGWAMYAVMGGAMAYFSFRKGLPTLVSATFTPLLGPERHTRSRSAGSSTRWRSWPRSSGRRPRSGLNGLQLNSGLDYLFDVPKSNAVAVMIIVVVTALFLVSATSGVEKGINFLANLGSFATIGLFLFFLAVGGSTVLVISNGHRVHRHLHHAGAADVAADRRRRRAVDGRLDDLLLGVVDLLGALRRHVRGPHLARAGRSASSSWAWSRRRPVSGSCGSPSSAAPASSSQRSGKADIVGVAGDARAVAVHRAGRAAAARSSARRSASS